MKGSSAAEKAEMKELMNWANEKIGLKLEKARREGKFLQISRKFKVFSSTKQPTKNSL